MISVRVLTSACCLVTNWLQWQIQFSLSPSVILWLPAPASTQRSPLIVPMLGFVSSHYKLDF